MFDIGWSELFVIAVVAVVVVGPKDLPKMLRTFGNSIAKMKRMAGDFQRQFNDALREAEIDDVKKSIEDIGKINPIASVVEPINKIGDDIHRGLQVEPPPSASTPVAEVPTPVAEVPPVIETLPVVETPPAAPVEHELPKPVAMTGTDNR